MEYIMLRLRLARAPTRASLKTPSASALTRWQSSCTSTPRTALPVRTTTAAGRLTPRGFLVSNQIIGALQEELSREKADRLARAARGDYRVID